MFQFILKHNPQTKALFDFFQNEMGMDSEKADDMARECVLCIICVICAIIPKDNPVDDVLYDFERMKVKFTKLQKYEFVKLVCDLANNTRNPCNRGITPNELAERMGIGKRKTVAGISASDSVEQLKVHIETEAKMHIQKLITDKKINLVYSFVSEFENSKNPNTNNSKTISNFFKNASVYVDISHKTDIRSEAAEIIKTGIKEMDAMQVALAIIGKPDYFLTTDKRLLKFSTEKIQIMNPIDFIRTLEV